MIDQEPGHVMLTEYASLSLFYMIDGCIQFLRCIEDASLQKDMAIGQPFHYEKGV